MSHFMAHWSLSVLVNFIVFVSKLFRLLVISLLAYCDEVLLFSGLRYVLCVVLNSGLSVIIKDAVRKVTKWLKCLIFFTCVWSVCKKLFLCHVSTCTLCVCAANPCVKFAGYSCFRLNSIIHRKLSVACYVLLRFRVTVRSRRGKLGIVL